MFFFSFIGIKSQSFLLDAGLFFETIGGVFGKAKKMAQEKGKK